MVIICNCSNPYPSNKELKYITQFAETCVSLSCFQKYSIEAIIEGHHSLVCVPTGNGKTLPAEFAIRHFCRQGKKVIYTSPIKALSNQKYYDFREKYPDISFGLLTGDIKLNPAADVLIMTAEILQNALYAYHKKGIAASTVAVSTLTFEMDFDNELACVVHDEVHSIGMPDRGHVWETIFMLLPAHVQNVMLSATLDRPEQFAKWCESIHGNKQVYLTTLTQRIVPLTHYSFITCNLGFFKKLKNKELEAEIRALIDRPIPINENSRFNEINYAKIVKVLTLLKKLDPTTKVMRQFVLNKLCYYLVNNNMLPCACFILSRKQLEKAAKEVTVSLFEDDSKTPYIIRKRCDTLLREKLTNYQEFIELPEYISMVALLEKGIATHHSGTIPILKEIVELLFVEGYIKLLFCTETFSCGLNMPIKTTIFTDLQKFDGTEFRLLHGYEYNQASGRAGRRGIDTKGYVIHLNNLFKDASSINVANYSQMMSGKPQRLISHYKVSYHLLLSSLEDVSKKSMFQQELNDDLIIQEQEYKIKVDELNKFNATILTLKTPIDKLKEYIKCSSILKKNKTQERNILAFKETYYLIDDDVKIFTKQFAAETELHKMVEYKTTSSNYLVNKINKTVAFLKKEFYIETGGGLLVKGELAKCFKEVPCLLFSLLLFRGDLSILSEIGLAMVLSCFTSNNHIVDGERCYKPDKEEQIIHTIQTAMNYFRQFEEENNLDTGETYEIHYDLMDYVGKWINADTVEDCKWILQQLKECGIFLGEFTKALLKIVAITNEIVCAAEKIEDFDLMKNAQNVAKKIQKYIVTNQSLYV